MQVKVCIVAYIDMKGFWPVDRHAVVLTGNISTQNSSIYRIYRRLNRACTAVSRKMHALKHLSALKCMSTWWHCGAFRSPSPYFLQFCWLRRKSRTWCSGRTASSWPETTDSRATSPSCSRGWPCPSTSSTRSDCPEMGSMVTSTIWTNGMDRLERFYPEYVSLNHLWSLCMNGFFVSNVWYWYWWRWWRRRWRRQRQLWRWRRVWW